MNWAECEVEPVGVVTKAMVQSNIFALPVPVPDVAKKSKPMTVAVM